MTTEPLLGSVCCFFNALTESVDVVNTRWGFTLLDRHSITRGNQSKGKLTMKKWVRSAPVDIFQHKMASHFPLDVRLGK